MKANTVVLTLSEYNNLREFEKAALSGNVVKISTHKTFAQKEYEYITKDDALQEIGKVNAALVIVNESLEEELRSKTEQEKPYTYAVTMRWLGQEVKITLEANGKEILEEFKSKIEAFHD